MRMRMWTPLPPEHSGIADYSYELLEALREIADVTAVGRDPSRARVPAGVPLTGPERGGGRDTDTVNVYQMGNNTEFHSWIYRQALAEPGIVVLHDTSLLDFNLSHFGGIDSPAFAEEMRYAHGPVWGDRDDPALLYGWPAVDVDGVKHVDRLTMTMERRIVSASRGVIVHDPFRADWLRARYPDVPVFTVASGAPVLDRDGERAAIRARLGWRDDHVVFGVFGGFTRIKRILVAVLAFAQVRRRWPQTRLLIVGHPREREIAAEVHSLIAEQDLADSVLMMPSPDLDEFQDLIVATDALIGLRWPTAGETSAVMMRAFGAGRMFITSDLPQHRHLDPAFCALVPTDPGEEAERLIAHLDRIACWPQDAREAGRQAREYVRKHACWPVIAAAYRDAATSVAAGRVRPRANSDPGVNVFADVRASTAAGETARGYALALAEASPHLTFTEFNTRAAERTWSVPRRLADLRRGKDYPVDLWLVGPTAFHLVPEHALDRHTIAVWTLDGPDLPAEVLAQLARVDELWVPSAFVAGTLRAVTDKPVTVIPEVVWPASATGDRDAGDGLVVLSECENALAAEVFARAFPESDAPARLVTGAAEQRAGCDVYLSLHRTTGFGRHIAEAMALGKPVIATGFGGNLDYMPPGSAALVGYTVRPAGEPPRPVSPEFTQLSPIGAVRAEPDLDQAARWLRRLAGNAELRRTMGAAAARAVQAVCGPEVVGAAMVRRLNEIAAAPPTHAPEPPTPPTGVPRPPAGAVAPR